MQELEAHSLSCSYPYLEFLLNKLKYYPFALLDMRSPSSKTTNENVWRFDFKDKQWTNLGIAKFIPKATKNHL